jgi:SagB-type dehydrogenase family enzyme
MNEIQPFLISFKEDISLTEISDSSPFPQLQTPHTSISLKKTSKGMLAILQMLSSGGGTEEQLTELVLQHDGEKGLPLFFYYLQLFIQEGFICHTVLWNAEKLASIIPFSAAHQFEPGKLETNQQYILSRFAYLHQEGEQMVLESPLAHSKVVLHDKKASAILQTLAKPTSLDELCREFQEVPQTVVSSFLSLLNAHQSLVVVNENGHIEEDKTLVQWAFHDLFFHTRSRQGRHTHISGANHRFEGKIAPLPAVKPQMSDTTIPLYKPNIGILKEKDVPFTRVMEERCSLRKQCKQPITLEQLGEFLYRTARVRQIIGTEERPYERSNRPYPGGGACYELELYLVVNTCEGLPAGIYHYAPSEHSIEKLTDRTPEIEKLLENAYYATAQQGSPQILIVMAARFQRVMWRYDGMAYAILKNVGVLYQSMYLVATAMGLAPCALGGGDSDLFAIATGIDYYVETSVGEFILGSRIAT